MQLIMRLIVVISLVIIKCRVALCVVEHSDFVESTVCFKIFTTNAIPGLISLLASSKSYESQYCIIAEITPGKIIRTHINKSPVDISIRSDIRETGIESPAVVDQSGTNLHHVPVGIERTIS